MRDQLILIQQRERLSDLAMATRLGIGRSTWNEIRNGRRAVSEALMLRAARVFPELVGTLVMSVSASPDEVPAV